ncbi:MAG: hypothetical protein V4591_03740 [Bdellovibrionota bacterium]
MNTSAQIQNSSAQNQNSEALVNMVSTRLREIIHDMNNALFVTKGFLEELSDDVKARKYLETNYDHESMADMVATIVRNAEKVDQNLNKLRKFAKEEIFESLKIPIKTPEEAK